MQGAILWQAQLQGANLYKAQMHGTVLWQAQLQGVSSRAYSLLSSLLSAGFESNIRNRIGKSSDLAGIIFVGEFPSGAETGAYTQEEAEQWIAEYNEAMQGSTKSERHS